MRRRSLRIIAKILLVAWTLAASVAAAQVCVGTPASHVRGHDHSASAVDAAGDHSHPGDSDDDCPLLEPAAVDSESGDGALKLPLALAGAPLPYIYLAVETLALRAGWDTPAAPVHIPAYLVAHRLRL